MYPQLNKILHFLQLKIVIPKWQHVTRVNGVTLSCMIVNENKNEDWVLAVMPENYSFQWSTFHYVSVWEINIHKGEEGSLPYQKLMINWQKNKTINP